MEGRLPMTTLIKNRIGLHNGVRTFWSKIPEPAKDIIGGVTTLLFVAFLYDLLCLLNGQAPPTANMIITLF